MSRWKQISGDMSWDRHGCVLAKVNVAYRQVDLVRIESWLELDSSAVETHGLYCVDKTSVDYEDLGVDRPDVQNALRSVGMTEAEYKRLPVAAKAEILCSYSGYQDGSRSVSRLIDAMPAPVGEIEFWSGAETEDKLAGYDAEARLEAGIDNEEDNGEES